MTEKDWMQILVNGKAVGVAGLKGAMEDLAPLCTEMSHEETIGRLLRLLEEKNYIPRGVRDAYGRAVLREFHKYRGLPVEEEAVETQAIRVEVLGPGCFNCSKLEQDVREVMAEMKLPGELLHVSDFREISRYGVMGAPALVINDRVVCVGQTPHRNKIKEWLKEAISSDRKE